MRLNFCLILVIVLKTCSSNNVLAPCGINLFYFINEQKIECPWANLWRVNLNLAYWAISQPIAVVIQFSQITTLHKSYNAIWLEITSPDQIWKFNATNGITNYAFDIRLDRDTLLPFINYITMNNYTVCSNLQKVQASAPLINAWNSTVLSTLPTTTSTSTTESSVRLRCGRQKHNYFNLLEDSNEAELGQWPWHVALYKRNIEYRRAEYSCGGSIIASNMIITVAHCVVKNLKTVEARRILVYAGIIDLYDKGNGQASNVRKIIVHPHYNRLNNTADITILELSHHFKFNDFVQPICLSGPDSVKSSLYGSYGTIVGYGRSEHEAITKDLIYAEVQIQSDTTCLDSDRVFYSKLMNEFTFCAGNGPTSTVGPCNGYSGGGLVISYPTRSNGSVVWYLRGLISSSQPQQEFCKTRVYTVYTDVASYYNWIRNVFHFQFEDTSSKFEDV